MKNYFLLFFSFFFISLSPVFAQQPVIITPDSGIVNLGIHSDFFLDESASLSVEDILSNSISDKFSKHPSEFFNFGITSSALWCRFSIENKTEEKIFLSITTPNLDTVMLYRIVDSTAELLGMHGIFYPVKEKQIRSEAFYFDLKSHKKSTTYLLKVVRYRALQFALRTGTLKQFKEYDNGLTLMNGIYFGFIFLMVLYNLFLFISVREISYFYYVLYMLFMGLLNANINGVAFLYLWPNMPLMNYYDTTLGDLTGIFGILFTVNFLQIKKITPRIYKFFAWLLILHIINMILIVSGFVNEGFVIVEILSAITIVLFMVTAIIILNKGYKPARFYIIAWSTLLAGVLVFILKDFQVVPFNYFTINSLQISSAAEALLLSLALADRVNTYKKEKENLILEQNIILESKVKERTAELSDALQDLSNTQAQLAQQEKLAALGHMTAGIAHEIQNPLNFVNNFSQLSAELIKDIKDAKSEEEKNELFTDLETNLGKINHHGKRADGIVKNMLEHSRAGTGNMQFTDINKMCEEYINLAYHGMRAKYSDFLCTIEKNLSADLLQVKIIPQDFSRVLLNLFNNALYAVKEKYSNESVDNTNQIKFKPVVAITTGLMRSAQSTQLTISIKDNGSGIPENIKQKIFDPFFTTKPTGQGTGLGLSLCYDIVKAHGGEIKVESKIGAGTEFIVIIPFT